MSAIPAASQEELTVFLKAAEERYAELGVDPATAAQLFDSQLNKLAQEVFGPEVTTGPAVSSESSDTPSVSKEAQLDPDEVVYKAAMDRMFEMGIPKAQADAALAKYAQNFEQQQAQERRLNKAASHLSGHHKKANSQQPSDKVLAFVKRATDAIAAQK
jgi:hypothetical protein